jgi:hypothetical protein
MRNLLLLIAFCFPFVLLSQIQKAPERKEGDGPWNQLIIRGVILVDGTGAPPVGPVDIVVEKNRIKQIKTVGAPGIAIDTAKRPKLLAGEKSSIAKACICSRGLWTCTVTLAVWSREPRQNTFLSYGWPTASQPSGILQLPMD